MYKSLYRDMLSFVLGKYLDGMAGSFQNKCKIVSRLFVQFYIPTSSVGEFQTFHILINTWDVIRFYFFYHSNSCGFSLWF